MNSSYVYNADENIKFSNNKSFTFELVFKKNDTNGTILFGCYSSEKNINEIWNANGYTNMINVRFLNCRFPSSGAYQIDVSKPTSISCTYDLENTKLKYYINNILVQEFDSVKNSDDYGFTLGMRNGITSASNCKIYSVRYYDRDLSETEVNNNYKTDKQKYGI